MPPVTRMAADGSSRAPFIPEERIDLRDELLVRDGPLEDDVGAEPVTGFQPS